MSDASLQAADAARAKEQEQAVLRDLNSKDSKPTTTAWIPTPEAVEAIYRLVEAIESVVDDPVDLRLVVYWIAGHNQEVCAELLDLTQAAVSYRIESIRSLSPTLRSLLSIEWARTARTGQRVHVNRQKLKTIPQPIKSTTLSHSALHSTFARIAAKKGRTQGGLLDDIVRDFCKRNLRFLDPTQPKDLQRHRLRRPSTDARLEAVARVVLGEPIPDVAASLGIAETTVHDWLAAVSRALANKAGANYKQILCVTTFEPAVEEEIARLFVEGTKRFMELMREYHINSATMKRIVNSYCQRHGISRPGYIRIRHIASQKPSDVVPAMAKRMVATGEWRYPVYRK